MPIPANITTIGSDHFGAWFRTRCGATYRQWQAATGCPC